MSVNIYNSNPNATSEEENFSRVADRGSKLASDTIYSNTTSGLTSVNVQGAIDEVNEKVEDNVEAISRINSDLSDISEDITLLATLNGATATSTWVNVNTTDNVNINSFRSFIVSLVKSDGTVMRNEVIPRAQMIIARYNENMITCSMSVVNGLTSGSLYGMCAVYSQTAFSLWINHANYSLKVYGCK